MTVEGIEARIASLEARLEAVESALAPKRRKTGKDEEQTAVDYARGAERARQMFQQEERSA
jgi:hypothetical protein